MSDDKPTGLGGLDFQDIMYLTKLGEGKNPNRRRATKWKERISPCNWCGHPITQRHHFLPVSERGENDETVQLCANCHELYHIVFDEITKPKSRGSSLMVVIDLRNWEPKRVAHARAVVKAVLRIRAGEDILIPNGNNGAL